MTDLAPLRLAVGRTRRALDRLRRQVHDQQAQLEEMRRKLDEAGGPPPLEPDLGEQFDALSEQLPITEQALADADTAHTASRDAYDAAAADDAALWSDGDETPVLLLPLRLEAVHQTIGGATQLLLRVYPDDVHIDAHEEDLTDTELAAGQQYWARVDAAPADGAAGAAASAWDDLVSRLGPARAAWTREATRPGRPPPGRREESWTRAAHTTLLPDRFVFSAYIEIDGELELAWRHEGKDLPDTLAVGFPPASEDVERIDGLPWDPAGRWLVDFEDAVRKGMGLKVALTDPNVNYALLTVVGLMAGIDADEGAARVQTGLQAHQYGQGLAFLPVGTPTNNTPGTRSAWQSRPQPRPPDVVDAQREVQDPASAQARLARALGLDGRTVLAAAPGATDDGDAADLRRLHHAFGLYFNLSPLLRPYPPPPADPDEIDLGLDDENTLPPDIPEVLAHFEQHVRSRGTLPTVRVGRQPYGVLATTALDLWRGDESVPELMAHLMSLRSTIEGMLDRAPRVGRGDDPDAVILDLLSRVPASLRIKMTQARPVDRSHALLDRPPPAVVGTIPRGTRAEFLALPDGGTAPRDALGPPGDDAVAIIGQRPLKQLLDIAIGRIDAFAADPNVDVTPFDARRDEVVNNLMRLVDTGEARTFHNIAASVLGALNLYVSQNERLLTDTQFTELQRTFVPVALARQRELAEAFVALEDRAIADLPGLDRLMLEVLDTMAHRVDAWITSFAAARLEDVRTRLPTGLHVGAYGWLTDVHDPGPLPPSDGYVVTPSIHHAVTAAVLRSGFLAHDRRAFAVDLQSWRVRAALDIIDGVRTGQPLSVLLGYRFERGLHDAEQDVLIEAFRLAFPLPLAVDASTPAQPATSRTAIEARNVVDGQRLRRGDKLPDVADPRIQVDPHAQDIVNRLLADLEDIVDAVGDLLLAESVHHLVGGNPLRAGLSADAIGRGDGLPAELDVVRTPRRAIGVTYHLGVLGHQPGDAGWPTERALAELTPSIDGWLGHRLGPADSWSFSRVGAPPLTPATLGWCAYDVVLGSARPVEASALGFALRDAAGDDAVDEAGWTRANELAVLAEQLRAVVSAATPLLPTHFDPALDDPWSAVDAEGYRSRINEWLDRARGARSALAGAITPRPIDPAAVRTALASLVDVGIRQAAPRPPITDSIPPDEAADLFRHASDVLVALDPDLLVAVTAPPGGGAREEWSRRAHEPITKLLGDAVIVELRIDAALPAVADRPAGAEPDQVWDWLRGIVPVRPPAAAFDDALTASSVLAATGAGTFLVAQQPTALGRPWVATASPFADPLPPVRSTLVLHTDGATTAADVSGFLVDSWIEAVPRPGGKDGPTEIAGVAFHHDRPGSRAPQALLIAVAPNAARGWRMEDLHGVIDETLVLTRMRALDLRDMSTPGTTPDMRQFLPIPGPP